jgi:CHAT domain-containing protein
MVPVRSRCGRASLAILALVIGLSGLFVLRAFVARQGEKTALRLLPLATPEFLQVVAKRTSPVRLVPDDLSALAREHFTQAQRELAAQQWANAQHEIEQALAFAELQCAEELEAEERSLCLALLREYYEWYIELLMHRQHQTPRGDFAVRAWQASERLHWWLASAPGATPVQMPRLSLTQLQQQLLDSQSLLLAYTLGTKRGYLWAIAKHEFTWFELPDRHTLEAKAVQLYQRLSRQAEPAANTLTDEAAVLAQELSALLLQPAAAQLKQRRLLVVADGVLQQLPFGVLPKPKLEGKNPRADWQPAAFGQQPLLLEHEIINWPSATNIWQMRQLRRAEPATPPRAPEATVAVIADPVFGKYDERLLARLDATTTTETANESQPRLDDVLARLRAWDFVKALKLTRAEQQILLARLPRARSEAEAIAEVAPRSVQWLDFAANRAAAVRGLLADYPVIHFATHGFFNRRQPALSGLVLSQVNEQGEAINGLLLNHEISALQLKAELVVVSACESALTETSRAGAQQSLSNSFLQAGARRVVASLWKVNDAATAELMKRFYQQMFNGRARLNNKLASPAAALRAAQLEMWRESRWQRPFYWAAFVLQGES